MINKYTPEIYSSDEINPATECKFVALQDYLALKEENERLVQECKVWVNQYDFAYSEQCRVEARVAELEGVLRDIKQHDIDETAKRILDGGRKFNFLLPLNIRERIAAALKEPANKG